MSMWFLLVVIGCFAVATWLGRMNKRNNSQQDDRPPQSSDAVNVAPEVRQRADGWEQLRSTTAEAGVAGHTRTISPAPTAQQHMMNTLVELEAEENLVPTVPVVPGGLVDSVVPSVPVVGVTSESGVSPGGIFEPAPIAVMAPFTPHAPVESAKALTVTPLRGEAVRDIAPKSPEKAALQQGRAPLAATHIGYQPLSR